MKETQGEEGEKESKAEVEVKLRRLTFHSPHEFGRLGIQRMGGRLGPKLGGASMAAVN